MLIPGRHTPNELVCFHNFDESANNKVRANYRDEHRIQTGVGRNVF